MTTLLSHADAGQHMVGTLHVHDSKTKSGTEKIIVVFFPPKYTKIGHCGSTQGAIAGFKYLLPHYSIRIKSMAGKKVRANAAWPMDAFMARGTRAQIEIP
eukprot:gene6579-2588_t